MTLRQLLLVLWARKWWVISMVIIGIVIGIGVGHILPPRYKATSTLVIDYKALDPLSGAGMPSQALPGYLSTQFDIIQSRRVALQVVRSLKLADNPLAREQFVASTQGRGNIEDWLANLLLNKLKVRPTRESSVIAIDYESPDPQFSAIVADAFAKAYIDINLELRVGPARETAVWFDEQIQTLKDNLEQAQARLSAYQREKGLTSTDERLDVETAKLGDISGQLMGAEGVSSDAAARKKMLDQFIASGRNPETLPDILGNPLIQGLKSQIATAETRRQQINSQLGRNHPSYITSTAEVDSLRRELSAEIRTLSAAINNAYRLSQRRVDELRSTANTQKNRMMTMNRGRDEMGVLVKEVENAQRALEAANSRFTAETLTSRVSQTNVMLLSPAVAPLYPSFPNPTLNVAIGILIGGFIGVNLALLREYFDRRVRSEEDLSDLAGLTVLGSIGKGRRRLAALRPALTFKRTKRKALPAAA